MDPVLVQFDYLKKKYPLKAIHLIKDALKKDRYNFDYLLAYARYLYDNNQPKESIKYFNKANKVGKLDEKALFQLALTYMKINEFNQAVKYFRKTYQTYPESIYNATICLARANKYEEALVEAKNINPQDNLGKETYKLILDITGILGDAKLLSRELEKYKSLFGEDNYYHFYLGTDCFFQNNYLGAVYHLSKLQDSDIEKNRYIVNYGISLIKTNQFALAKKVYEEMISMQISYPNVYIDYVKVLYRLKLYEDVKRKVKEFIDQGVSSFYFEEVLNLIRSVELKESLNKENQLAEDEQEK